MRKMNWYLEEYDRDVIADIFGVSLPTINRWATAKDIPEYAKRIMELREKIRSLENELNEERRERRETNKKIENFIDALDALNYAKR